MSMSSTKSLLLERDVFDFFASFNNLSSWISMSSTKSLLLEKDVKAVAISFDSCASDGIFVGRFSLGILSSI